MGVPIGSDCGCCLFGTGSDLMPSITIASPAPMWPRCASMLSPTAVVFILIVCASSRFL